MTVYSYVVTDTLNDVVSPAALTSEILASSIDNTLNGITVDSGDLHIDFDGSLDTGEETTLDGIVAAHTGVEPKNYAPLTILIPWQAVSAGVSDVIANDNAAIEFADETTGYAATELQWSIPNNPNAVLRLKIKYIIKATGTGTYVRLIARLKRQAVGTDSSKAFDDTQVIYQAINFTTIGEVFEGTITLDASALEYGDAIALQIGRDGNNELTATENDDVDQSIQVISVQVERGV